MTLTPAQVRDHARALITMRAKSGGGVRTVATYVQQVIGTDHPGWQADYNAIADAIRTARITVDWDEEIS